ncbi:MAG: anthranilate phosphoribosyltransferase [Alphaproteobacteria bacterium]|nr:anthranilate phosphoribosyltransferase [Alphaproteobacteria bacterium SS10]
MKPFLAKLGTGASLTEAEAVEAFDIVMSGSATPAQLGAFLMGMRVRGETVDEITGGARVLRSNAAMVQAPADAIDTCGTGGDGKGTLNVSTAVAFVVAACGVPVAKHGNRAASSKSGAADVLEALGVNVMADIEQVEGSLKQHGVCFLMAPKHHAAMRHVVPARKEMGLRTIFNLLGPLANPAGVRRQLLGVFSPDWLDPMATVLGRLGSEVAWVVHGHDGLDELTITGPSEVAELRNGVVQHFTIEPGDAGLSVSDEKSIRGGTPEQNAAALLALLDGKKSGYRDIVVLNAAAALLVSGKAADLKTGAAQAKEAIDKGLAKAKLEELIGAAPLAAAAS